MHGKVAVRVILGAVLGFLTILAGCKTATGPKLTGTYPLAPGTIWQYTEGKADTVTGTTVIGGKTYAVISGDLLGPLYARILNDGELRVRLSLTDPEETTLFDLGAQPKDSWNFTLPVDEPPATVTMTSSDDVVTVPAGTFKGCDSFYFDVSKDAQLDITYVVAPDTGLVYMLLHDGTAYSLVSFTPGAG